MKFCTLILSLVILPIAIMANIPATIDSLKSRLDSDLQDSARFEILLQLHQELIKFDTAQSLSYLRQAIELSDKKQHIEQFAKAQLKMANFQWKHANLPAAGTAIKIVQDILAEINDPKIQATFFM